MSGSLEGWKSPQNSWWMKSLLLPNSHYRIALAALSLLQLAIHPILGPKSSHLWNNLHCQNTWSTFSQVHFIAHSNQNSPIKYLQQQNLPWIKNYQEMDGGTLWYIKRNQTNLHLSCMYELQRAMAWPLEFQVHKLFSQAWPSNLKIFQ
jgi:hypothetical protein